MNKKDHKRVEQLVYFIDLQQHAESYEINE